MHLSVLRTTSSVKVWEGHQRVANPGAEKVKSLIFCLEPLFIASRFFRACTVPVFSAVLIASIVTPFAFEPASREAKRENKLSFSARIALLAFTKRRRKKRDQNWEGWYVQYRRHETINKKGRRGAKEKEKRNRNCKSARESAEDERERRDRDFDKPSDKSCRVQPPCSSR